MIANGMTAKREFKVDMHNHTVKGSEDSTAAVEDLIERACQIGLDALVITEHHNLEGASLAYETGKKLGFPVLRGCEVKAREGDFLVIGLDTLPPKFIPALKLIELVHVQGGVIGCAHPFRELGFSVGLQNCKCDCELLDKIFRSIDFVETLNGWASETENAKALHFAEKYKKPGVGGSDTHHIAMLGSAVTVFSVPIFDEQGLIEAIKHNRILGTERLQYEYTYEDFSMID